MRVGVLSRHLAAATAALTVAAMLGNPAQAAATAPGNSVVISGQARFEVLSPTLIRTEYAGDSRFVDAATFNVVGRRTTRRPHISSRTTDDWLTIDTGAVTLRYKVGSGPFGADNLTVRLTTGRQAVQAAPWADHAPPTCAPRALCEAESGKLQGVGVARDHGGYTGQGFAAGFEATGDAMTVAMTVPEFGTYLYTARYANFVGGDGQNTTRNLTVAVDGTAGSRITLPSTGSWDTWALAAAPVTLAAGRHEITLRRDPADSGHVNVDSIALLRAGEAYPQPVPPGAVPCAFGALCEADTGVLAGGAKPAADHNGHSGDGFLAGLERAGASDTLTVTGVPSAGSYRLQLRYANGRAGRQPLRARDVTVQVGGDAPVTATLAPTSGWDYWRTVAVPVTLAAGTNTVRLGCPTDDSCNVNIDTVAVAAPDVPLLAPHAPLGGYRRSLDGVDGSAATAPGILYADGWSLLDDTASALFDPGTQAVTQRAAHPGGYQDGYVFAYGQDYGRALRELGTLTGPTALLPRWAYGVWYSEYYDRSAADFQQTIVPRFRAEGVPLDVLVVDTDFKAGDRWNGWDIDPARFPDPAGFFDWAHAEGLHTTLNIHPSIRGIDPRFATAQAAAKGKLVRAGCNSGPDCYVFDWGDPDQVAAYLGLHRSMAPAGVDFWWLDWCCDGSRSSLPGVTPDAWINLKYATENGFAFSRAYGSLQSGGYSSPTAVPTGPWADKRTTLHFTGDTISDWETLQFEVGYTPGESAATGLAAVSHDIGGHTGGLQQSGTEPGSTKLPDDLYARWVQLGTFQPVDRLHSNHSDRLPWQYGPAAEASAVKFLRLREQLMPYTYSAAAEANRTGLPMTRPMYLAYPDQQEAYATAGAQYLYGADLLVAPATEPGASTTTSVWFPPGSTWTDYFTGETYPGGTTRQVTTSLDTMPVFLRSGGIVTTRVDDVPGDDMNPLGAATVTVAAGGNGRTILYEDDGTDHTRQATTLLSYRESRALHTVRIEPVRGHYTGQPSMREWTVVFAGVHAPRAVRVDGRVVFRSAWSYAADTKSLTVRMGAHAIRQPLTVTYE
ncbi:TIM-barrel domain-containing protein [Krasilnikovia sp. M28-CT-15]|uniref:TIM-barrel domain-containing protein n=1 Tax=Krasilnikovia sp. M28-CT-15 TaxID=3373540 RepID=UPI003875F509